VVQESVVVIQDFVPTKSGLVVVDANGGPSQVRRILLPTKTIPGDSEAIPLPPVSSVDGVAWLRGEDGAGEVESYTPPPAWYRASGMRELATVTKTALAQTTHADFTNVAVTRDTCTSKDGTKVPMTILAPRSARKDGTAPALLTGYGGFGIVLSPAFR